VPDPSDASATAHGVPFREAARFWMKLGFINFGGPTGQIAIMHDEIVERRKWISNGRFLHALNYCMLLPGPEAQQLAIYIGWLLHKVRGGLVAGIMFVLPSFFVMLGLSWLYAAHGDVTWVSAMLSTGAASGASNASRIPACPIASIWSTPGYIGRAGKCPASTSAARPRS